jgi:hypothetical protein
MATLETLGQQVGELEVHPIQSHAAILDSFMSKVLPDVDVLGTLPTTEDAV